MGLMKFIKKVHDPFGHGEKIKEKIGINKLKKKLGIDKMEQFEDFNISRMWDMVKDDPTRLLYGSIDPLSTKMWNEALGTDNEPFINQMGGPTEQTFRAAQEAGIDITPSMTSHQIAAAVASFYAGGAGASAIGGMGAGAIGGGAGSTIGGLGGGAMGTALTTAVPMAVQAGAAEANELIPPEMQEILMNAGYPVRGLTAGLPGLAEGGYMNYAKGGSANQETWEDSKEIFDAIREVSQLPGGPEIIFSMASNQGGPGQGTQPVRFYNGGAVAFNSGGLAEANEYGGRGDDEMIVHMAPEEYEALTSIWGPGEVNPNTGMPEYGFLSKIWKKVKKVFKSPLFSFLAPIALNVFAPGLGAALGTKLGLTGKMAATVGNTLVRSGMGAVGGGSEGALSGAISGLTAGGTGADIGAKLGLEGAAAEMAGNAIIGGIGGEIGGGGFAQGAVGNVAEGMMMKPINAAAESAMGNIFDPQQSGIGAGTATGGEMSPIGPEAAAGQDIFGGQLPGGAEMTGAMSPVPGGAPTISGMYSGPTEQPWYKDAWDWTKDNPLLAVAGLGMAGSMMGSGDEGGGDQPPPYPNNFMEGIPLYDFDRTQQSLNAPSDYYTYGQIGAPMEGEHQFFSNNTIGQPVTEGGAQPLPGTTPPINPGDYPDGLRRGIDGNYMTHGQGPGWANTSPLPGLGGGTQSPTEQQQGIMAMEIGGSGPYSNMMRKMQDQLRAQFPGWYGATGQAAGGYIDGYAGGGYAQGGGSGRDDTIEALLSDGEYVMDAETVALLGDGSNDEGAARLDQMREELRKHKGQGLARGKFSADARRPMQYMKRGGRARFKRGGPVEARLERIAIELGEK